MNKKVIVVNNPHDHKSVELCEYLDSIGVQYCKLDWYTNNNHPKQAWEALRLVYMYINGAMEGVGPIPPPIDYTDKEIEDGDYPNEHCRWIMQCECHKGKPYIGPPLRSMPSVVRELESGEWGLWDLLEQVDRGEVLEISPQEMWEYSLVEKNMVCSVAPGLVIAGQWLEGALQTANSPHYSNRIIQKAVQAYVKQYCTIDIRERELIAVESKRMKPAKEIAL